jgi:hypothetical protein
MGVGLHGVHLALAQAHGVKRDEGYLSTAPQRVGDGHTAAVDGHDILQLPGLREIQPAGDLAARVAFSLFDPLKGVQQPLHGRFLDDAHVPEL